MTLLPVLALALTAQFTEGSVATGGGCRFAPTGTVTQVVATNVGTFKNTSTQQPKQGEIFTVYVNVLAMSQPCWPSLTARPGLRLPAGFELVPANEPGSFAPRCYMGRSGSMTARTCPSAPTEVLFDGTMLFDKPSGLWEIPDGQTLQVQIPVRGTTAGTSTLTGYVDFVSFDGYAPPVTSSVQMRVFDNPPSITYPSLAVLERGPYSAHVYGYVDPHYHAGTVRLELAPVGQPFSVVDSAQLDASLFRANIDTVLEDLLPDTAYQFRFTYQVAGQSSLIVGATQSFQTQPAPQFPYVINVVGDGTVTSSVPSQGGTFVDNTVVTLTAVANPGSRLVAWDVNGQQIAGASTTLTINTTVIVHATFEQIPASNDTGNDNAGNDNGGNGNAGNDAGNDNAGNDTNAGGNDTNAGNAGNTGNTGDAGGDEQGSEQPSAPSGTGIRVTSPDADEDVADDEGGCAATKPAAVPALVLLLALRRRRRA